MFAYFQWEHCSFDGSKFERCLARAESFAYPQACDQGIPGRDFNGNPLDIDEIRLAGGGARNKHWNQMHANILGRPVSTLEVTDAALVGAAMCAGVGVGAYANLQAAAEKFVKLKDIVEPQQEFAQIYRDLYENYKRTFLLLSENRVFERLRGQSL